MLDDEAASQDGVMQPENAPAPEHGTTDPFFAWLRKSSWRRSTSNKWIGGVCSGFGAHLGIDPVLLRAVALMLMLSTLGLPVIAYLAAWAFLPDENDQIEAQRALNGAAGPIVLLLMFVASVLLLGGAPDIGWLPVVPVSLMAAGLIWWLLVRNGEVHNPFGTTEHRSPTRSAASPQQPPPPPPPKGATPAPASASARQAPSVAPVAPKPPEPAVVSAPAPTAHPAPYPTSPPRPTWQRPHRLSVGFFPTMMVVGLAILVGVGARQLHQHYDWPGLHDVVGLAAAVAVLATALIVIGLLGRRGGFISAMAVLTSIATALTLGGQTALMHVDFTHQIWAPTTAESVVFHQGVGQATLDLSRFPTDADDPATVTAHVSVGILTVTVPAEQTVRVVGSTSVGEISVQPGIGPDPTHTPNGAIYDHTFGSGRPDVIVQSTVGFGELSIQRSTE